MFKRYVVRWVLAFLGLAAARIDHQRPGILDPAGSPWTRVFLGVVPSKDRIGLDLSSGGPVVSPRLS